MSLNPMASQREQRSLFGEILDWMLAPLLLIWPMSVALTWFVAQGIAHRPYDRELGAMRGTGLGNAPGDGTVVRDTHYEAALASHQTLVTVHDLPPRE